MKRTTIISALLLASVFCFGQSNDLPARSAYKLTLAVDSVHYYEDDVKASNYVLPDNMIQIYPGEKIYVEVELAGDSVKSMKSVKENKNPGKTMTISFEQVKQGRMPKGMSLSIQNPFNKQLVYHVKMFLQKYNKWAPTDVLPVQPKLGSFETWPDVIVTLALGGWEFK